MTDLSDRPLQIIQDIEGYYNIVISEVTLRRIHKKYDLGWGHTYAKRTVEHYEKNPKELLEDIDIARKTNKPIVIYG